METSQKLSNLYMAITAVKNELSNMEYEYYSIIDDLEPYERTSEQKAFVIRYETLEKSLEILEKI